MWRILQLCFFPINLLTAEWTLRALIDFTLSNARRFYWSTGNPLDGKGLKITSDENGCDKVDIEPSGVQFWSEIKLQMISKLNSKSYDYLYNKYINSWTWFECISESAQLLEERWQISKWTNSSNVLIIRSLAMFLSWVQYEWSRYQDKITDRKSLVSSLPRASLASYHGIAGWKKKTIFWSTIVVDFWLITSRYRTATWDIHLSSWLIFLSTSSPCSSEVLICDSPPCWKPKTSKAVPTAKEKYVVVI